MAKRYKKKLPKYQFPSGATWDYFTGTRSVLKEIHENVNQAFSNKIEYLIRRDAYKGDNDIIKIGLILDELRAKTFNFFFNSSAIEKLVKNFTLSVKKNADIQFSKQFRTVIGVDPLGRNAELQKIIEVANRVNISYIQSIPSSYHDKVEAVILQGVRSGKAISKISEELQNVYNVSRDRALFIARDQAGALTSDITKAQHNAVGLKTFVWRTVGDDNVRKYHDELNGRTFTWEEGEPLKGMHPGEDYGCRCVADINEEELFNL